MLKIELTASPDRLMLGTYEFFHRGIIIGSATQSDLILDDSEVDPIHLYLFSTRKGLFIRSLLDGPAFFINSKKVKGHHPLQVDDVIRIGKSELKILAYVETSLEEERKFSQCYSEHLSAFPKLAEILGMIETEMIFLDNMDDEFRS